MRNSDRTRSYARLAEYMRESSTRSGLYLTAFATVLSIATVLAGCDRRRPHGVAERYLENLKQFNYAGCYNLLSDQDRADRSLHEFLTEIPLAPDVSPLWFRPILHITQYELGPEHRNSDGASAYVPVRIATPNLPLWERTLDAAAPDGSGADAAQRSLDRGDYPKRTYDDRVFLLKEHHRWRVVAGFAARDRVIDRHREIMADYYAGRYDKVVPAYESMITELENQQATSSLGLAGLYKDELSEIEKIKARLPSSAAYAGQLKLSGIAMKMSEQRVPAIFGAVTNSGDKAIDDIKLAVTWYEGRGKGLKAVHREEHAVVITPIEFTDFGRPVLPFVSGETRHFGFILSAPAEVQQNASPYVTIGTIAFSPPSAPLPRPSTTDNGASANVAATGPSTIAPATEPPGTAVTKPEAAPKPQPRAESVTPLDREPRQ
jgi:hypothetical protein